MGQIKSKERVLPVRLREQLENERIRFSMACNTLVMRSSDSRVVQLNDGSHASVPVKPIRLRRGNPHDVSGRTRFYDRMDPAPDAETGLTDAEFLDFVAEYIARHPGIVNHHAVQLKIHGETDPVQPFPGYDKMDEVGIRAVLEHAEYDLKGLLKYELEVRPTQVDADGNVLEPRDEVITVLEEIAEERELAAIVDAEAEVQGL